MSDSACDATRTDLHRQILDAFDALFGVHLGYRPVHAKGIAREGTFTAAEAEELSRAPHLQGAQIPVIVRFSDFTGLPDIPDADANAIPGDGGQVPPSGRERDGPGRALLRTASWPGPRRNSSACCARSPPALPPPRRSRSSRPRTRRRGISWRRPRHHWPASPPSRTSAPTPSASSTGRGAAGRAVTGSIRPARSSTSPPGRPLPGARTISSRSSGAGSSGVPPSSG
jgi:hypothetical protein